MSTSSSDEDDELDAKLTLAERELANLISEVLWEFKNKDASWIGNAMIVQRMPDWKRLWWWERIIDAHKRGVMTYESLISEVTRRRFKIHD